MACGQQHAIALDDTGLVYVWGYNGYCRLGLGDQKDVLKPKAVPHVRFIYSSLLLTAYEKAVVRGEKRIDQSCFCHCWSLKFSRGG